MLSVVIAIHLMLVIAMIGVVLLQKSEGGGLISSTSGFLSNRGTANVLTRTTAFLAAGFFVTSLALSWLASYDHKPSSLIGAGAPPSQSQPAGAVPPTAPPTPGGHGVLDRLGGTAPPAGTPSAPPSGPEVPQSR